MMEVKVLFFGILAEIAGTSWKHYLNVKSLDDLKKRIEDDYPEIIYYNFRISLNNEIVDDFAELKEYNEVALMPPFAGG